MKTKLRILATAAGVVLWCSPVFGADIWIDLPPVHQGARHMLFSGTRTILGQTDAGAPTAEGAGFRNAMGTSEMTLTIPDLGITDLVIQFSTVTNADLDAEGTGPTWGALTYYPDNDTEGYTGGRVLVVGRDDKTSDTLTTQVREYGGAFWGGPLEGAHFLASETIEVTTDGNGTVISRVGVLHGVLLVSWYEGFAPFEGIDPVSLPPLKPVTELPPGLGWRAYAINGRDAERGGLGPVPAKHYHVEHITCEELGIRDLWIPTYITGDRDFSEPGPVFGWMEFAPMGHDNGTQLCGQIVFMGVWGPPNQEWGTPWTGYHEHTGAFWDGPFAGCLYMVSQRTDGVYPTPNAGVLLVPDYVDLGAPQKMLNVSERGRVGTGEDILIAGFVVSGETPRTILVRAIGPALEQYGVTDFLEDPELEVYRTADPEPILVGSNDNWGDSVHLRDTAAMALEAGAFALETDSRDAAMLFSWLEPGVYTVQVSGVGNTTGVALAEVYQIGN